MYNFFITKDEIKDGYVNITGADYNHAVLVLRLKIGEKFLVSDGELSHLCSLEKIENDSMIAKIICQNYQDTSLPIKIHLFQGLPKSDKMELIIQKAVELGVKEIIPVEMERCVVKLDNKKKNGKTERWQAIAESAAKQSKCNSIPTVSSVLTYEQMLEKAKTLDLFIVPYECEKGMQATKAALEKMKSGMSVGVLIGPEGGFSQKEIDRIKNTADIVSLGKRILRAETAAITAVSMIMLYAEMNL